MNASQNQYYLKKKNKPNVSKQLGFAFNPKSSKTEHSLLSHQAAKSFSLVPVLARLLLPVVRSLPLSTDNSLFKRKKLWLEVRAGADLPGTWDLL